VQGQPLATQPGFAQGEAFGQVYRPAPGDYPIDITGLEMILAAPPSAPSLTTHAVIEVWLVAGDGPGPDAGKTEPDFRITTQDLFNPTTRQLGMPLVGNTGLSIAFDPDEPSGHPPSIKSGNFMVMIRFTQPSKDMQGEWGTFQCSGMFGCGCQNVGTLHDQSSSPKANVMNLLMPLGSCSGAATGWKWMNEIGVTGDVILRVVSTGGGGCEGSCAGKECGDDGCGLPCGSCTGDKVCKSGKCVEPCMPNCAGKECGDDGCGSACGSCDAGETCEAGLCKGGNPPPLLAVSGISPDWGWVDEATPVTVFGAGFQQGAIARLGAANLVNVVVVSDLKITATVPNLFSPAKYTLSVMNPGGATALFENAFEIRARPQPEPVPEPQPEPDPAPAEDAAGGDVPEQKIVGPADSGCTAGTVAAPAACLLLALAAAALRRRRG
jgi:hypothetical protein